MPKLPFLKKYKLVKERVLIFIAQGLRREVEKQLAFFINVTFFRLCSTLLIKEHLFKNKANVSHRNDTLKHFVCLRYSTKCTDFIALISH